jgi:lipopolysaccharide/colanic/teichoic acid biosynthesis glycosyltransferase
MFAKRILDLLLCCLALPNGLAWVAICTLGERVSSAGSMLSGGKQIGLNRRPFEVLSLATCISARHIPRTVTGRFELGPG